MSLGDQSPRIRGLPEDALGRSRPEPVSDTAELCDVGCAGRIISFTETEVGCPFEPGEKQALLESAGLDRRGLPLTALMELAVRETEGATAAMHRG